MPVKELFEIYLSNNPEEKAKIEDMNKLDNVRERSEDDLNRARSLNHLEVSVLEGIDLQSRTGVIPSVYVHFKLMGFHEVFTKVITDSSDPEFDHTVSFPFHLDKKLLESMSRQTLIFTIFDDKDRDERSLGVLGETNIILDGLQDGKDITGTFPVKDRNSRRIGSLRLQLKWRDPIVLASAGGSNQFTLNQVNMLLKSFDSKNEGFLNYKEFIKWILPSTNVKDVRDAARSSMKRCINNEIDMIQVSISLKHTKEQYLSPEDIHEVATKCGFDLTLDDIYTIVGFMDREGRAGMNIETFINFCTPPNVQLLALESKLHSFLKQLRSRNIDIREPFELKDQDNTALISLIAARECLVELGIVIVDDVRKTKDVRSEPDWDKEGDVLKDKDSLEADEDITERDPKKEKDFTRRDESRKEFIKKQSDFKAKMTNLEKQAAESSASMKEPTNTKGSNNESPANIEAIDNSPLSLVEKQLKDKISHTTDLKALFSSMDRNGDGNVSKDEFVAALKSLSINLSPADVTTLMSSFDADNNGKIDYIDFQKFASYKPAAVLSSETINALSKFEVNCYIFMYDCKFSVY
jgi:Ca2+-binding EF-hand superfamily protein